jgi:seryl-tRNA(Sec) selenium transferase
MLLDTALRAATALAQLLQARHGFTTAQTAAQRDATTAALISAGEQLRQAGEEIDGFFRLAEASRAAGRRGRDDLN